MIKSIKNAFLIHERTHFPGDPRYVEHRGENICPNANATRPAAAQEYCAKEEEEDQIDYGMI